MKKYYLLLLFLGVFTALLSSCRDDDEKFVPQLKIVSQNGELTLVQGDTLHLSVESNLPSDASFIWMVQDEVVSHEANFDFVAEELGSRKVNVKSVCAEGEVSAEIVLEVYGKYKYGTFVLNEGINKTTGSLIFISPKGVVMDSVYYKENGGETLGKVTQDLFIRNNKMYIVSQEGGNAGYLTVVNAGTLKKEKGYQTELNGKVSQPTHVVVLGDDDIYLRDNAGVKVFHPSTGDVALIGGTERATKNTMVVVDNKVFACVKKSVVAIEAGKDNVSGQADFDNNVAGIAKSSDNNLWVVTDKGLISKMNTKTFTIEKSNQLEGDVMNSFNWFYGATSPITAKGDTLYINGSQTKIFRHIFSENKTELMVDASKVLENAFQAYNTVAVHPLTGEVVLNTIKGWSNDSFINHITFFDFSGKEPKISADYENHTLFPAGVFFTYNFE